MELIKYQLYHATKRKSAISIVDSQTFNIEDDELNKRLLGEGAYFYDNETDAYEWNEKDCKDNNNKMFPTYKELNDKYCIILADIEVNKDGIMDLDDRINIIKYKTVARKIKDEVRKTKNYNDKNELGTMLNYLFKNNLLEGTYILVKCFPFPIPNSFGLRKIYKRVFCIKNVKIIKKFELGRKFSMTEYNDMKLLFS